MPYIFLYEENRKMATVSSKIFSSRSLSLGFYNNPRHSCSQHLGQTTRPINKAKEEGFIDAQTATELSKQNLTNAQTAKAEEETKQIVMNMQIQKQKIEEEINLLQAQREEAISRKDYNEAKKIEQQIKNKWENTNQITNQVEKYGNLLLKAADTSISAVKVATDALPVGTVTKMTKGLVSTIKSKKLPWQ